EALLGQSRVKVEDKVWRAHGLLRSARLITSDEVMDRLSDLRLGVNMGIVKDLTIKTINEIFIQTQPAHLQKMEGKELSSIQRDAGRAEFIRSKLDGKA
ncbi:MAG: ATP--guanido phosphotransferase, partial [Elusimicrobiota bacterium]